MAQTLSALAEPTSPPTLAMANAFRGEMAKLENLGRTDLKAIAAVALTYAVAQHADGVNYKSNHPQLITDAQNFLGAISLITDDGVNLRWIVIQTVLAWQVGYDADNTLSTDVNTLLGLARDLMALPEEVLNRILIWLQYMMSV